MGVIHVLPESIANKIAAGEIVDRPASIVKELVENALDAQAKTIEVRIRNGGKSLISIADDGFGMSTEDASLAFERHATSKIAQLEDLLSIASFGFRGEALPSIAAVSRTTLATGQGPSRPGTLLQLDGGAQIAQREIAPRAGTLIEVRDLFFNTPARRKFIKSDQTESGHIVETLSNLALARPDVRFALFSGQTLLIDAPAGQDLFARAKTLYGEEAASHLLELSHAPGAIQIRGVIGKPQLSRATRAHQSFFVNGRWVRSPALSYALQEGFQGLLMHGRFPVAFLFIDVDPEQVDVNVHPTKQQVKLSNEADVKALVIASVRARLRREPDLAPQIVAGLSQPAASWNLKPAPEFSNVPALFQARENASLVAAREPLPLAAPVAIREGLEFIRILGQVQRTFILAETRDGYAVIDQHAAHERVMFETLLAQLRSGRIERQPLLIDAILEAIPRQQTLLASSLPWLCEAGFEIELFGEGACIIRAVPAALGDVDPVGFLRDYLDEKEAGAGSIGMDRHVSELAALIACKRRSVKANEALGSDAMRALLERLSRCENPFNCPHGRPTVVTHSIADLERVFKRV